MAIVAQSGRCDAMDQPVLKTPELTTERLVLRLPLAADATRVAAYFNANREHHGPWSPPRPEAFFTECFWAERLPLYLAEFARGEGVRFVLSTRADPDGEIVGDVNLSQICRGAFQACYLGYNLDHCYVGSGVMAEALTEVIRYAFEDLMLHRIQANYIPTNERSGRLLRRLGFTVEGYARDYLYIDGAWRDHVLTSLTNTKLEAPV
jgi:ribosomal-protein-alanine N-acetyltransferase